MRDKQFVGTIRANKRCKWEELIESLNRISGRAISTEELMLQPLTTVAKEPMTTNLKEIQTQTIRTAYQIFDAIRQIEQRFVTIQPS